MTCAFDLAHYRELLAAARPAATTSCSSTRPRPGRSSSADVDLSLDAALQLGELEAEAGVGATYFLMTESVFYNLASSEGTAAAARLRELGTASGSMRSTHMQRSTTGSTPCWRGTTPTRST